jgi:hypothetical protein
MPVRPWCSGIEVVGEHLQLACALRRLDDAVVVDDRDSRRVVAAIFEATKASHEHVDAIALSDVSDDSTHALDCICGRLGACAATAPAARH